MDDRVLHVAYALLGTTVFLLVKAMWGFEREIQERGLEGEQAGAQRLSGLGRMMVAHVRWAGRIFSLVPPITAATRDPGFFLRVFHGFRVGLERSLVAAGKPYALSANDILGGIPVGFAFPDRVSRATLNVGIYNWWSWYNKEWLDYDPESGSVEGLAPSSSSGDLPTLMNFRASLQIQF